MISAIGIGFGLFFAAQSPPPPDATSQDAAPHREYPLALLRSDCLQFESLKRGEGSSDIRDCRVSEFGAFGTIDGQTYYYALYCLVPKYAPEPGVCGDNSFNARYHRQRGLAIFQRGPSAEVAQLVFERVGGDVGLLYYDAPQIVHTRDRILLYIPIHVDGTGAYNSSEYYTREEGKWKLIESQAWLNELVKRVPAGLQIRKGVWPDLRTMQADAGLYREGDANCCPTAGTARIQLAIRSNRFTIESLTIDATQ